MIVISNDTVIDTDNIVAVHRSFNAMGGNQPFALAVVWNNQSHPIMFNFTNQGERDFLFMRISEEMNK